MGVAQKELGPMNILWIGLATLRETLRQVPHRTNAEWAARAHERFHT